MSSHDQTASLMTPAKLAQMSAAKAPASPSAFLDQMAADVGHQHLARLKELHPVLGQQARDARKSSMQPAIERARKALQAVDFAPMLQKKGFLAGLTGKARSAGAEFESQVDDAKDALKAMASEVTGVAEAQRALATATERTLVECEVEYRALDRIIEQRARWLQDMRNQLKTRQQQAGGDAALLKQLEEDAARCELLVTRLKALRAVATACQQSHELAQVAAQRRSGVAQRLQKMGATELRSWQSTLPPVASFAAEGRTAGNIGEAQETHQAVVNRLGQLLTDCVQLHTDEQALEQSLAALGERLATVS